MVTDQEAPPAQANTEQDPDIPDLSVDDGSPRAAKEPVRRCLVSGDRHPKEALIRFVLGPDGTVVPDLAAKLPGRGLWLSADAQSIKTALDRKLFARAARAPVVASVDLVVQIEALLTRRCVETLSLARRAGEAVCGFEKTRAALISGSCAVLLQARDGAADGRAKLAGLARETETRAFVPVSAVLDAVEMGEAFGRDAAVHAALLKGGSGGGLSRRFQMEAGRLKGFRETAPDTGRLAGKDDE